MRTVRSALHALPRRRPESTRRSLVALQSVLLLVTAGCAMPESTGPAVDRVSLMAFNVENLFDTVDAAGKDDATYLPIAQKQSQQHIAGCNEIEVDRWRDQCLNWDWNDQVLETKLRVTGAAIRAASDDGRARM